jgi:hypothetical protein
MRYLVLLLFLLPISFAQAFDDFEFEPKEGEVICFSHTFKTSGSGIEKKCDPSKGEFEDDELAIQYIRNKCESSGDKKWIIHQHACVDKEAKMQRCFGHSNTKGVVLFSIYDCDKYGSLNRELALIKAKSKCERRGREGKWLKEAELCEYPDSVLD